jgi:uronate dehydrogenase
MSQSQRVLITGAAGRLGRAAVRELLSAGHVVHAFDLVPTLQVTPECQFVGSLQDYPKLKAAAQGTDTIIHLAATPDDAQFPRLPAPNDSDNFLSELLPNNIVGTYHVLETARTLGIRKVILASTGQVVDGFLDEARTPVTTFMGHRPRYLYACTKVFLEAAGQVYATQHQMNVLVVRLGWCPRDAKQVAQLSAQSEDQDVYLSPGDAGRFFRRAVEAQWGGFEVVFATSKPRRHLLYDLEPARRVLGFVPQESWPLGAEDW